MSDFKIIQSCIDGAALAPLTSEQRQKLAQLARSAYARVLPSLPEPRPTFDVWRHAEIRLCTERAGIRECRQEDYDVVQAHLLRLIGQPAMAQRMQDRADCEPRRQALGKLYAECSAAGDVIDRPQRYVASIAHARFKTFEVDQLSPKQIWMLVFDLRRNAQRRRAKRVA